MQNRIDRIKKGMKARKIKNLLVTKPENQLYLTGFHSTNCQLIFTEEFDYLLTDFRYIEEAGELTDAYHVVLLDNNVTLFSFLNELDLNELAIEEDFLTYGSTKRIGEATKTTFVRGDGIVETVRSMKGDIELNAIKRAQEITDKGFIHMLGYLTPGITEKEAALELELYLRKEGADSLAFETILVSGTRTSFPHGSPSDKKLETGDFITIDFGCKVDGYCSDMTRTVALGAVNEKQRQIYDIVLEAQMAGCRTLKKGISCKDADRACRDVIEGYGYGSFFGHGTGHGLGLEIHEAPTLNTKSDEILAENMVVTIEPGIYLPKEFGVRIEDLAIITDSGIINLTNSEKELIII